MKYKILKSEFNDFQEYLKETSITSFTSNSIFTLDNNEYIFEDILQFNEIVHKHKVKEVSNISDKNIVELSFKNDNLSFNDTTIPIDTIIDTNLIYGKDPTERIVNISIDDNLVYIYRELEDGIINTQVKPANYWIIGTSRPKGKYISLEGNQPYKYLKEFDNYEAYKNARIACYKNKNDVYSISNLTESYMVRHGYTYFKGMKINEVSVLSFDIETTTLDPKNKDAQVLLISNTYRNNKGIITRKLFSVDDYENDTEMIENWCIWVRRMNPSIILGHNIYGFDLPYLNHRGGGLKLGRDDSYLTFEERPSNLRVDGSQQYTYFKINLHGVEIIDTWMLAIKFDSGRKYPNYKLKDIIEFEGLTQKNRQFYDASTIKDNWYLLEEKKKIKEYCKYDADDSLALYDLMGPCFFYLTQNIPKPYTLINVSASGAMINSLMVRNYLQINNSLPKSTETSSFTGALAFGIAGLYKNCLALDIISEYPSIMLNYQICPKDKDPKNFLLKTLDYFRTDRLKNKKLAKETKIKYYDDIQNSSKILINSYFGFMGCQGLLFNYPEGAAEVCRKGREIMNIIALWATGKDVYYWFNKAKNNEEENNNE